jgi:hypothetical protein
MICDEVLDLIYFNEILFKCDGCDLSVDKIYLRFEVVMVVKMSIAVFGL